MEADWRVTMFDVKDVEVEHEEIASHVAKNLKAEGKHSLLSPTFDHSSRVEGLCTKPLSCFGCGIGWFCFVMGFVLPIMWYYATILYLSNYSMKDPRERGGLAASAIAALVFSVIVFITILVVYL